MYNLKDLQNELKIKFKKGDTLKNMIDIVNKYNSIDWINYCNFSNETYKRNLVFRNDDFEIMILCWKKGQKSKIHNHPKNGCILKLLSGELIEKIYYDEKKLQLTKTNIIKNNNISYMDKNGLHSIEPNIDTVSLHIYSPPNYSPKFFY